MEDFKKSDIIEENNIMCSGNNINTYLHLSSTGNHILHSYYF